MKRFLQSSVVVVALVASMLPIFAGRMPAPGIAQKVAGAGQTITYPNEWFRGGEMAVITVSGDGDSDLDLYVYDQNGNLIAKDTGPTDRCVVRFTPRWTGPFSIKVVNAGDQADTYVLHTN